MESPLFVLNFCLQNTSMLMTKLVRVVANTHKGTNSIFLEDSVCKEVSVAVNDAETRIIFVDHQHGDMSVRIATNFSEFKLLL